MKQKSLASVAYSIGGVIVLAVILLALNYLAGRFRVRADLTHGNVYTLSNGSKKVLANLKAPIRIRYYANKTENVMPVDLKNFARRVEDLLTEYKQFGKGKVMVEKFDPLPDSDAADSAALDGVEPQTLQTGEQFYLGVSVSQLDRKVAISALAPNRESLLEYDLTRAITQITRTTKPLVGIMSGLPIFGQSALPMPGAQQQPAWAFVDELRRDYDVKEIALDAARIDGDVKVLLVVHPRDITEATQYAIDQFVLRGGKLIAFVDPYAYFDQRPAPNGMPMGGGQSSLPRLFKAWGVSLAPGKVVTDLRFSRPTQQGSMPTVLYLSSDALSTDDVVVSQLGSLIMPFAGAFTGKPSAGITQKVLAHSSTNAALKDALTATMPAEQVGDAKSAGVQYPLALRLSGKFTTAFAEGEPKAAEGEPKDAEDKPKAAEGQSEAEDNPRNDADKESRAVKQAPPLKQSAQENVVVLVADADMLSDQASVQIAEMLGQRILIPKSGNLGFVQGMVELFSGDESLIDLRSRATQFRPLSVVREMEAKAAESYLGQIRDLEASLNNTQARINELQKSKSEGQQFILSPEQKTELENFRKKQAETKQVLKDVRRTLRAETDKLENWTKIINIGAMPLLVALIGVVLALAKRRRMAAR